MEPVTLRAAFIGRSAVVPAGAASISGEESCRVARFEQNCTGRYNMCAVIYTRFSSDLQRDESIEDQVEGRQREAERQGWTLTKVDARSGPERRNLVPPPVPADDRRRRAEEGRLPGLRGARLTGAQARQHRRPAVRPNNPQDSTRYQGARRLLVGW